MRKFLNKSFYTTIFLIFILLLFSSCKKNEIFDPTINDYTADFDSVWTTFALKYPLFEYKKIDWDEVYQEYNNQFTSISIEERNNNLIEMLSIFRDTHIYINTSAQDYIGVYKPPNFTINYNIQYLTNFIDSIAWHDEGDSWGWARLDKVGYIRFTNFRLGSVDTNSFDIALDSLNTTEGIIIDVRELLGGNLNMVESICDRFTDKNIIVGYQLYRNGPGYNDYAELIPLITNPSKNSRYLKTVIVLIGQLCGSAGEIFAETMSHFANTTLIGDTTLGSVESPELYKLSDGTEYSVPIVAYLNSEKEPLEWKGVFPDIYIDPSELIYNTKHDMMIEEAINIINQKHITYICP